MGIDALGQADIIGAVSEIVPSGDPSSRSFVVKARLPITRGIRSGMFGRARFAGDEQDILTVARSALISRGQLTGVMVVDPAKRARFRVINPGRQYEDRVEVLSGVDSGERVVIERPDQIQDGSPVSVGVR